MTHAPIVQGAGAAPRNGDQPEFDVSLSPILGPRLPTDVFSKMRAYVRAVYEDRVFDKTGEGLEDAIEQTILCVQRELRGREGEAPLDYLAAVELYYAHKWAIYALLEWKGNKAAKQTLIRLAGGRPLMICVGGGKGRQVVTIAGTYRVHGGCLRVFDDCTRLSGRMWPQKCPDCRSAKSQTLRASERALKRRVAGLEAIRLGFADPSSARSLPAPR